MRLHLDIGLWASMSLLTERDPEGIASLHRSIHGRFDDGEARIENLHADFNGGDGGIVKYPVDV